MSFTKFLQDDPLLTRAQVMQTLIRVADDLNMPDKKAACVICGMAISTEVGVRDNDPPFERRFWCPANRKDPESLNFKHDSESDDGRSVGYLQQQNSAPGATDWWGTMAERMDLYQAAKKFMQRLPKGYHANDARAAGQFAQRVQGSAFPDRYAEWWGDIISLYNAVSKNQVPVVPPPPENVEIERGPWTGDPVWLADVLRAEGVKVFETPGWRDSGHGDMGSLWGVICHHTGNSNSTWESIRFGRPDLRGPLSQIHLRRDGTAEIVAAGVCWHAGTGAAPGLGRHNANARCIGIEAQNNGSEGWSPAQYEAYVKICAAFCRRIGVDASHVISHQEYDNGDPPTDEGKWDPGLLNMDQFRRDVQRRIDQFVNVGGDDMALVPQEEWVEIRDRVRQLWGAMFNTVDSQSIYADPDERSPWATKDLIRNMDGMVHQKYVEDLAAKGDDDSIMRIVRVAAGRGRVKDQWAIDHANAVLKSMDQNILREWGERLQAAVSVNDE